MKNRRLLMFLIFPGLLLLYTCKKESPAIPEKPSNLTLAVISQTEIDLNWKDNSSNETGFRVERSPNASSGWAVIGVTSPDVVTYQNTGLTTATTYYYRVQAYNATGSSDYSNTSFATTSGPVASLATVTTTAASSVTTSSAMSGGTISSDGGAAITAKGVCWSTSASPTTSNNKTADGTGSTSFSSSIAGLSASTTYYVRAYAINSVGTAYGNQISFTTSGSATIPVLTTTAASTVTSNSASSGGNITSDGGAAVTARGVCWSTSQNPTTANSKTSNGSGTGSYASSLTGLSPSTTYYVRAYATNSVGTAYGNQVNFTTSASVTIPVLTTTAASAVTSNSASSVVM